MFLPSLFVKRFALTAKVVATPFLRCRRNVFAAYGFDFEREACGLEHCVLIMYNFEVICSG